MNDEGYGRKGNQIIEQLKLQKNYGFKLYHSYGETFSTYLDGNDPRIPKEDIDAKKNVTHKEASQLFRKPIFNKRGEKDGDVQDFIKILNLVLDREKQPVLFHCYAGKHRTGMVAMALRHIEGRLTPQEIEKEYRDFATDLNILVGPRQENIDFINWFIITPDFISIKEKYKSQLTNSQ